MSARAGVTLRVSNFIGRKKEMAELRRLLAHTRLLTVLGPGGAGKTRLVTEFARNHASRFADKEAIVELVEVRDAALIPDAIARAAGVRLQAKDTVGTLVHRLRSREMLLVVDNCEHLTDGAAAVVGRLLGACPRLVVLATSRERLNIDGEVVWRLPPLALPNAADKLDAASATEAVRLFVDRARNVHPGFDITPHILPAVIAICRGLDGMPLAIELAAARTSTLTPGEIIGRLDDRLRLLSGGPRDADARHRTLRATIDWSYELLDASERTLLQRLSVFSGPVRADAIEHVCGTAPLATTDVTDGLQHLADKSMLQIEPRVAGSTRYRLLETIRDYAADKLVATGEGEGLRDQHLAFYERLSEEAFDARMHRGAMAEHRRLWDEMADVRAALDVATRDVDAEVALLGNLRHLWMIVAPEEGLRRLARVLTDVTPKPTRGYVRALWTLQALVGQSGHYERSLFDPDQLSEFARQAGEESLVAIGYLGTAYNAERIHRDLDTARAYLEKAAAEFTRHGDLPDLAMVLASIGAIELQLGNLEAARPWIQRGLDVAMEAGDDYGAVGAQYTFGWLEILSGDADAARLRFVAALDLVAESDSLSLAQQVEGLAVAGMDKDARRAVTLFGASSRLREEVETPVMLPWSIWLEPAMADARAALPADIAAKAWESGRMMSAAEVLALARRTPGDSRSGRATRGAGGLSKREIEVAALVANGLTSRAIAERLFLSERTVESHLEHILTKLGFSSRAQVAGWAAHHLGSATGDI
jgi:predicted ATPase/DNA-binding CsgD family transcriptional regulator